MDSDDRFRACDADRERVAGILRDAYTAGRLGYSEFDERMTAAFAAQTWGDLRALTRDLPVAADLGPLRIAAPANLRRANGPRPSGMGVPVLPIAAIWLMASLSLHEGAALIPVVFFLLAGIWWAARMRSGGGSRPGGPR